MTRHENRRYVKVVVMLGVTGLVGATPCKAQSTTATTAAPDTATALTTDMQMLDTRLLERTRGPLERWGNTFMAYAMYIPDTAGPARVFEIGAEHSIESREPGVLRDSLRSAVRKYQTYRPWARTIGIIADSIAGPVREAVDGADGPDFPRKAITELEDRSGRCRRLERDYRFVKDTASEWGFGRVVFDAPRITRCEPRGYWPPDTAATEAVEPKRQLLAAPIVRTLVISSLGNYFSVVGDFHGKLTVFDDSIVVKFAKLLATRRLPNDNQRVRLDSIRVGVGVGDAENWTPVDDSEALRIGRALPKGGKIVRRNVRFVMKHERRDEDADAWIVVTFHITVARPGETKYSYSATTYAHSAKGILALPSDQKKSDFVGGQRIP